MLDRSILRAPSRYAPHFALLAGLIGEVLCLTLAFDGEKLIQIHSGWAGMIAAAPQILRFAVAALVVILLLSGRKEVTIWADDPRWRAAERWPFLAAHVCAFGAFAWVSAVVFTQFALLTDPRPWVVAWCFTGSLTLLLWALTLFPIDHWIRTAIRLRSRLAWGIAGGAALWAGGLGTEKLWTPLAKYTFYVVGWILKLIYGSVITDSSNLTVGTRSFTAIISPQCSGFEGIGLIVAFLTIYLWISRKQLRFPRAFLLLPIGVVAVWVANSLRIVALVVLGSSGFREIARGGFHSQAGWLAFNAVGLGLAAITTRRGYFAKDNAASPSREGDLVPAYIAPLTAVLAASMITGAFSAGFDWLYPIRVVAAAAVLWMFRCHYRGLLRAWSPVSVALGSAAFVAWLVLMPANAAAAAADWPSALGAVPRAGATAWLLIRIAGYVITVPIVEELAFRGFLTRRLIRVDFQRVPFGTFSWTSFLIGSVIFGAFHGKFWLPATAAGMIFAVAMYRKGSIGDAVQAHATANGLIALYVLWTGRWFMWS